MSVYRLEYDGTKIYMASSSDDGRPIYAITLFEIVAGKDKIRLRIFARNDSVAENAWRIAEPFNIGCPPGDFVLGAPEANTSREDELAMGPWFIPVNQIPDHFGIGIHGGGSCKGWPESQAAFQGWCPTINCFRTQNEQLEALVALLQQPGIAKPIGFSVIQPN